MYDSVKISLVQARAVVLRSQLNPIAVDAVHHAICACNTDNDANEHTNIEECAARLFRANP